MFFQMLLIDDFDNYCLYSDLERDEFLFRIFFYICLGGRFNQYEDEIQFYLDVIKQVYKDFIRYIYRFYDIFIYFLNI